MSKECERCKEEHDGSYGSGRFCSSKCARGFATKAKRKEINEKVSKKLKGRKYSTKLCNQCKRNEINGKCKTKTYCCECLQYSKSCKFYKKIGTYFPEKSFLKIHKKTVRKLYNLYHNKKLSFNEIKRIFNIEHHTAILGFFYIYNIPTRNFSKAQLNGISQGKIKPHDNMRAIKIFHRSWNGKEVYLRSSYELEYAKELDEKKINYEVESLNVSYFDTQLKKKRISIPDFYLVEENKIVEVKSSYTYDIQNMKDRVKAYRENGYSFELQLDKKKKEINY